MKNHIDILIRDGLVLDGSGSDPIQADVAVSGDKILAIGSFADANADTILQARGLVVSPGFIDAHAHSDFTLLADPRAEGKILQGVTTEINGNCGMSAAPLYGKASERREDDLRELGISERWNTVREYRMLIEGRGIALNSAMLAGHGNIRGSVVGYENRRPSCEEYEEMKQLLEEAVKDGCIGLSTGLIYPPGIYSQTDELTDLCSVLKHHNLPYTSHMRSEGNSLVESVREVIDIGRNAGIKAHISHIKTAGRQNWHKADAVISEIEAARQQGIQLTCDRYPYIASSTDLDSILPAWAFEGGNEEELGRISHQDTRSQLRSELLAMAGDRTYWERVIISSVSSETNAWMEGKTIAEISSALACDEPDAIFRILAEERLRVGAIFLSMSDGNLRKFLSLPYCAIGSDSSARCFNGPTRTGKPHPRTFGTFPRFLGRYAREEKLMSLSMAVYKSSMLPASIFGLRRRGQLKDGMFADITIFDPSAIMDISTFASPFERPEGIPYVLVNGVPVVWEGRVTRARPGRMLVP
ncbi:MAG: D-aminoacylase [Nitrospirae bacterium]|nr:D-aminoacylase [Nitrospirota bacterium]